MSITQNDLIMQSSDDLVISTIFAELQKAELKFPGWPDDIVHGAAIIAEESGEVIKAALDYYYSRGDVAKLIKETAQTGAMAIRLLIYLSRKTAEGI